MAVPTVQAIRPMRAATLLDSGFVDLVFPLLASPKIDGIRCVIKDGLAYSRTFTPFPNVHLQAWIAEAGGLIDGLDGELVVGNVSDENVFNRTQSVVMSTEGDISDLDYHVFDFWSTPKQKYIHRLETALRFDVVDNIVGVKHHVMNTVNDVLNFEKRCLDAGFEGIILRSFDGQYKYNKATVKEGTILKLKRFIDAEAEIIGFVEEQANKNEKVKNGIGLSKRGTQKANKSGKDTLGKFLCRMRVEDRLVEFGLGSGIDAATRKHVWENQDQYIGQYVTFKYQSLTPDERKPRHPTFVRLRNKIDVLDDRLETPQGNTHPA